MSGKPLRQKTLGLCALLVLVVAGCDTGSSEPGSTGSGGSSGTGGSGAAGRGGTTGGSGTAGSGTAGSGTGGTGTAGTGGAGGTAGSTGGATAGSGGSGGATGGTGGTGGRGGSGGSGAAPDAGGSESPRADATPGGDGGSRPSNPDIDKRCTVPVNFRNTAATTPGGMMFTRDVPDAVATMQTIARTVCNILYRDVSEVKNVNMQALTIDTHSGVAFASGGGITFSANHISNYAGGNNAAAVKFEIHGVLTHESAHVWQYTNGGGWLVEAMADYVRYRGGYDKISRRGPGGNWNSPYTTGGFFIVWIEDKYDKDFGYKVNMGMKNQNFNYANFVQQITGKPIDMVWQEYQNEIRR